jgi:general secretion pathway protein D
MISQYYLAIEKMKIGELQGEQGAQTLARRAYERDRRFTAAQRLLERIDLRIEEQKAVEQRERLRRRSAPDFVKKREDTELWIQAAIQHIRVNEYDQAERELKKVLAVDNMNESAIVLLKEVQRRRLKVKSSERDAMSRERMTDVTETWNPRDYYHSLETSAGKIEQGPVKTVGPTEEERLIAKLESIMIPEVVFREANVHDVVEFLVEASREGDQAESDPQRKGVNIVLNVGDESRLNTISFSARYVSLLGAVKILSEVAGLKYRIEKNIVLIVPLDDAGGRIVTRFYPVDPAVMKRLTTEGSSGGAGGGGLEAPGEVAGGGFLGANEKTASGGSAAQIDLREYFRSLGVDFPKGSSISYNSGIGKIIVANTEDNLATFERIFNELNVIAPQVEIETRFVDIAQSELEDIGLQWSLTDAYELLQQKGSGNLPMNARPRVVIPPNASSGGFTSGLRFGTENANAGPTANNPLFAVQTVLTNPELTWMIRAIEQSGHGDLLSAPKVTTQPGLEATVKVATEYIYPTEYRVEGGGAQIGTAGTLIQTPIVIPDVFETREVGVILTVLPEVSPDRKIISLTLAPEVVTEPYWYDYGYTLSTGQQVPMKMPFFKSRNASTTVKVYDGATVVLGGLISEGLTTRNDKIPFLGSLPLVGGLFRSKHSESEKRNLLIFVTARLVDPAGKSYKEASEPVSAAAP